MTQLASLGKIEIITGSAVGKTTLAIGTAIRQIALGKKVMFFGFDCRVFSKEEQAFFARLNTITTDWHCLVSELGIESNNVFDVRPEHRRQAEQLLDMASKVMTGGKYDVVILDAINPVLALGVITPEMFIEFLNKKPVYIDIILTGENCPSIIKEKADSVLEIYKKK